MLQTTYRWVLRLEDTQVKDEGTYECQVSTEIKTNALVHLKVLGKWKKSLPRRLKMRYILKCRCSIYNCTTSSDDIALYCKNITHYDFLRAVNMQKVNAEKSKVKDCQIWETYENMLIKRFICIPIIESI